MLFQIVRNGNGFSITPKRPAVPGLIVMTTVLWLIAGGFFWAFVKAGMSRGELLFAAIPLTLAAFGAPAGFIGEYLWQKVRGPALIFDSSKIEFTLPRAGKRIAASEVETFAVVSKREKGEREEVIQLQIYSRDGQTYHLLTTNKSRNLQPFLREIRSKTAAPVQWRTAEFDDDELKEAENHA